MLYYQLRVKPTPFISLYVMLSLFWIALEPGNAVLATGWTQDLQMVEVETSQQVPSVIPPLAPGAPLTSDLSSVGFNAMGSLPETDGDRFMLSLAAKWPASITIADVDSLVQVLLPRIGYDTASASVVFVEVIVDSPVNPAISTDSINAWIQATIQEVTDRYGTISDELRDQIEVQAERIRLQSQNRPTTYVFRQEFEGRPVELSTVKVIFKSNQLPTGFVGRLFNRRIQSTNQRLLSEEEAKEFAFAYVQNNDTLTPEQPDIADEVILPFGASFREAWRFDVWAASGEYRIWVDAEDGDVLRVIPLFFEAVPAVAIVTKPYPGLQEEQDIEVDDIAAGESEYSLVLNAGASNEIRVVDGAGTDCTTQVSGGEINFSARPPSNCDMEGHEENAFAWVYTFNKLFTVDYPVAGLSRMLIRVDDFDSDQARANPTASGHTPNLRFGEGSRSTAPFNCDDGVLNNAALDATVIAHEFGHLVSSARFGTGDPFGLIKEGLSDFLAMLYFDVDEFGTYWNDTCPPDDSDGLAPRMADLFDTFPERATGNFSEHKYIHGQILAWALWSMKTEIEALELTTGMAPNEIYVHLLEAMGLVGNVGPEGLSDLRSHKALSEFLEAYLFTYVIYSSGTCPSSISTGSTITPIDCTMTHNWYANKLLAGFARAGLFLAPVKAVIDSGIDIIRSTDPAPVFDLWAAQDFCFDPTDTSKEAKPFAMCSTVFPFSLTAGSVNMVFSSDPAFPSGSIEIQPVDKGLFMARTEPGGITAEVPMDPGIWSLLSSNPVIYYKLEFVDASSATPYNSIVPVERPDVRYVLESPRLQVQQSSDCGLCDCLERPFSSLLCFFIYILSFLAGLWVVIYMVRRWRRRAVKSQ